MVKKLFVLLLLSLIFVVGLVSGADCGGAVQCGCGDNLIENHTMWYDLIDCSSNGLIIGVDGIILDCDDHSISGVDSTNSNGIYLNAGEEAIIKNCNIGGFDVGIYLEGVDNNILVNNVIGWNRFGISVYSSGNNDLSYNTIEGNTYQGMILHSSSSNNNLWNNIFIGNGINGDDNGFNNWNITNIGNHWDDFESNPGYPTYYEINGGNGIDWHPNQFPPINNPPILEPIQNITINQTDLVIITVIASDPDNDTLYYYINDSRFEQNGNNFTWQTESGDAGNYNVLVTVSDNNYDVSQEVGITVLPDFMCGEIINEDTILTNNLLDCPEHGIIIGSSEITLDCNNFLIDGDNIGLDEYGVYVNDKYNVTVQNCKIQDFNAGIYLSSTSENNFLNFNILNNNEKGIILWGSSNNDLNNNIIESNNDGIYLWYSSDNNLINNNITNNNYDNGVYLYSSFNNVFLENTIDNNNKGIYISYSSNNRISTSNFNGNQYGIYLHHSEYNSIWDNYFIENNINAYEESNANNNQWNTERGNFWSDYEINIGYPNYYDISGPGNGIDNYPIWLNYKPVLETIGNQTTNENETLTIDINAYDHDNDTLTYYINAGNILPSTFRFDSHTGLFEWMPTFNDAGEYEITFNVTDGEYWDSETITMLVNDVPLEVYIDNLDSEFSVFHGDWNSMNIPNAYNNETSYNSPGTGIENVAWRVNNLVLPGTYDVYVWKFENDFSSFMGTNVHYMVYHRTGTTNWILVDQSTPGNEWIYLGEFEFDNSHAQGLMITDEADGRVAADAIKLFYKGPLSELDSDGPELFD
ncbi:MAG: right-handed parallel beta-helix repeat-containing protein [Nanoarchaeota archaeon]|nr:right-handed parallel beta-helix repeat-containing protein [Nanoarchaeota archaeon]